MKKLITFLFFLSAFASNAQRTMFWGLNNYVRPIAPAETSDDNLVTNNLILWELN